MLVGVLSSLHHLPHLDRLKGTPHAATIRASYSAVAIMYDDDAAGRIGAADDTADCCPVGGGNLAAMAELEQEYVLVNLNDVPSAAEAEAAAVADVADDNMPPAPRRRGVGTDSPRHTSDYVQRLQLALPAYTHAGRSPSCSQPSHPSFCCLPHLSLKHGRWMACCDSRDGVLKHGTCMP